MTRQTARSISAPATPRGRVQAQVPPCKAEVPSPLQGEPIDYETQGVALGWSPARFQRRKFTNFDA